MHRDDHSSNYEHIVNKETPLRLALTRSHSIHYLFCSHSAFLTPCPAPLGFQPPCLAFTIDNFDDFGIMNASHCTHSSYRQPSIYIMCTAICSRSILYFFLLKLLSISKDEPSSIFIAVTIILYYRD